MSSNSLPSIFCYFLLVSLGKSESINPLHDCTLPTGNGTNLISKDLLPYALIWIKFSFKPYHFVDADIVCATLRYGQDPISYEYQLQYIKKGVKTCYVKVFYEYNRHYDPNAMDSCGK